MDVQYRNKAALKELLWGVFWIAVGLILTEITEGYIFYGAGVYGLYRIYCAYAIKFDN
jgi:hypothetical protein